MSFDSNRCDLLKKVPIDRISCADVVAIVKLMSFDSGRTESARVLVPKCSDWDYRSVGALVSTCSFDSGRLVMIQTVWPYCKDQDVARAIRAVTACMSFDSGKSQAATFLSTSRPIQHVATLTSQQQPRQSETFSSMFQTMGENQQAYAICCDFLEKGHVVLDKAETSRVLCGSLGSSAYSEACRRLDLVAVQPTIPHAHIGDLVVWLKMAVGQSQTFYTPDGGSLKVTNQGSRSFSFDGAVGHSRMVIGGMKLRPSGCVSFSRSGGLCTKSICQNPPEAQPEDSKTIPVIRPSGGWHVARKLKGEPVRAMDSSKDKPQCALCKIHLANVLLLPCGDLCVCIACAQSDGFAGECPKCSATADNACMIAWQQ
jgi:hypothetical protein